MWRERRERARGGGGGGGGGGRRRRRPRESAATATTEHGFKAVGPSRAGPVQSRGTCTCAVTRHMCKCCHAAHVHVLSRGTWTPAPAGVGRDKTLMICLKPRIKTNSVRRRRPAALRPSRGERSRGPARGAAGPGVRSARRPRSGGAPTRGVARGSPLGRRAARIEDFWRGRPLLERAPPHWWSLVVVTTATGTAVVTSGTGNWRYRSRHCGRRRGDWRGAASRARAAGAAPRQQPARETRREARAADPLIKRAVCGLAPPPRYPLPHAQVRRGTDLGAEARVY